MPTDISKAGNGYVIDGVLYTEKPLRVEFNKNSNGRELVLEYAPSLQLDPITIPYSDLTIAGVAPASVSAATTSLATVFPNAAATALSTAQQALEAANTKMGYEISATIGAISSTRTDFRIVQVTTDNSWYLYNGTTKLGQFVGG
jgi:hypothetical protein